MPCAAQRFPNRRHRGGGSAAAPHPGSDGCSALAPLLRLGGSAGEATSGPHAGLRPLVHAGAEPLGSSSTVAALEPPSPQPWQGVPA